MKKQSMILYMLVYFFVANFQIMAQKSSKNLFGGLEFRNIGPAMTSGRIADIAIHPENENVWYALTMLGNIIKMGLAY